MRCRGASLRSLCEFLKRQCQQRGTDSSVLARPAQVRFVKSNKVAIVQLAVEKPICVELFSNVPQLGRFTLRDEGRTIAIGKIIKLPSGKKGAAAENTFSAGA